MYERVEILPNELAEFKAKFVTLQAEKKQIEVGTAKMSAIFPIHDQLVQALHVRIAKLEIFYQLW